jgi:hypothetical protein
LASLKKFFRYYKRDGTVCISSEHRSQTSRFEFDGEGGWTPPTRIHWSGSDSRDFAEVGMPTNNSSAPCDAQYPRKDTALGAFQPQLPLSSSESALGPKGPDGPFNGTVGHPFGQPGSEPAMESVLMLSFKALFSSRRELGERDRILLVFSH